MRIKRVSPRGLIFYLYTICEDRNKTEVQLADTKKRIIIEHSIEQISQGWWDWQIEGKKIQEAFPFLNSDEREFLLTGLTSKEWKKIFPPEEE
jgi:hypothetical protein